jgi:hypothetical protein
MQKTHFGRDGTRPQQVPFYGSAFQNPATLAESLEGGRSSIPRTT